MAKANSASAADVARAGPGPLPDGTAAAACLVAVPLARAAGIMRDLQPNPVRVALVARVAAREVGFDPLAGKCRRLITRELAVRTWVSCFASIAGLDASSAGAAAINASLGLVLHAVGAGGASAAGVRPH